MYTAAGPIRFIGTGEISQGRVAHGVFLAGGPEFLKFMAAIIMRAPGAPRQLRRSDWPLFVCPRTKKKEKRACPPALSNRRDLLGDWEFACGV